MRGASGVGCIVADPAGAVHDGAGHLRHERKDVEIAELSNVVRVDEAFLRDAVPEQGSDVDVPGEFEDDESDDHDEDGVREHRLKTVCNEEGDSSCRPENQHRENQAGGDDDDVAGKVDSADHDFVRQSEVIEEEVCRDRRSERVCDHFGECADERGEDPEEFAAVAQFNELSFRETAGLAPAVCAESGKSENKADRGEDVVPEGDAESGLICLFASGDEDDDGEP